MNETPERTRRGDAAHGPAHDSTIDVIPATADRWPDVVAVMGGSGGDRGCWCPYYRWPSSEFSALGAGGGRRAVFHPVMP